MYLILDRLTGPLSGGLERRELPLIVGKTFGSDGVVFLIHTRVFECGLTLI